VSLNARPAPFPALSFFRATKGVPLGRFSLVGGTRHAQGFGLLLPPRLIRRPVLDHLGVAGLPFWISRHCFSMVNDVHPTYFLPLGT
jgi:hypothetical protein